jgi:hexosaminidase
LPDSTITIAKDWLFSNINGYLKKIVTAVKKRYDLYSSKKQLQVLRDKFSSLKRQYLVCFFCYAFSTFSFTCVTAQENQLTAQGNRSTEQDSYSMAAGKSHPMAVAVTRETYSPVQQSKIAVIPEPVELIAKSGSFSLNQHTCLSLSAHLPELDSAVSLFVQQLQTSTGLHPEVIKDKNGQEPVIILSLNKITNTVIGKEGYTLNVEPKQIKLSANTPAGIFYGVQTLLQMLPVTAGPEHTYAIPCVSITDYPRFGWRGLMLDVSRHFFTKAEVERYIDEMSRYKFNIFHWHLTDDNGWRIEIKSLPQLTGTGAWRVQRTGRWDSYAGAQPGETASYGGFYTQDDIREVIVYAGRRNITVLPEIDIPAHSLALIASYPNLSCTGLPYSVNPGSDFYTKEDNVLCVGNDSVYTILDKIITEVAALFPCPYIHIGGDEAYKGFWKKCPKCQQLMKTENLSTPEALQSYFEGRVEKIVESKGKKIIGWDEILEGGLTPDATVMSWRGMQGGISAVKLHHPVIMSPWGNTYLDLYQGDASAEPATYGLCRLSDCYNYDPVPAGIDSSYILGGQGNLWTESVPVFRQVEYMTWPRAMALAEVYWSPKVARNWDGFIDRMEEQLSRLDQQQVKYARSVYNAIVTPSKDTSGVVRVKLSAELKDLNIYYSFDNTFPDNFYPEYTGSSGPLYFPNGASRLNVITYRNGKQVGQMVTAIKADLEKQNVK